jgi:hypothetical protein
MGCDEERGPRLRERRMTAAAVRRAAGAAAAVAVGTCAAFAHPMGNVSISHYAGIEIRPDSIEVKFLLDFAEIPSASELESVDPDRDDRVTPEEREAYLDAKTREVLPRLRLEVNGRPLELRPEWRSVTFPQGEGGLSTVRVAWVLRADLPEGVGERNFLLWNDSNYEGFGGWKEIRLEGVGGVGVGKKSLRDAPSSSELSDYPEAWLQRPPEDTKAWCQFGPEEVMARSRDDPAATERSASPSPAPAAAPLRRPVAVGLAILGVALLLAALRFRRRRAG